MRVLRDCCRSARICSCSPALGLSPECAVWCTQERLYSWLGGLRASNACNGLLTKLADLGLGTQQRMKLEALRVR